MTPENEKELIRHTVSARAREFALIQAMQTHLSETDRRKVTDEADTLYPYMIRQLLMQLEDKNPQLAAEVLREIEGQTPTDEKDEEHEQP